MIISIDPGINNCGISVIDINNHFKVQQTVLVKNTRKFTDAEKEVEEKYGNRTVKVQAIIDKLEELYSTYKDQGISAVVIEAPFYNTLTPSAYGSLLEIIFAIKYSFVIKYDLNFKLIEPLLVKKFFANNHLAKKEVIKQFLLNKKANGSILIDIDIETLSEHEIDSIAIGYIYYMNLSKFDV